MVNTTCIITRAGIRSDGRTAVEIKAADNITFGLQWFLLSSSMSREMLAISLAAITTGKQVTCVIKDPSVPYSEVLEMYLNT